MRRQAEDFARQYPGNEIESRFVGGPVKHPTIGTANEMKLPNLITSLPGPNAKKIIARDTKVISPSYTRGYPMVAKSGRGAMVEDVDGNTFLDFAAGIAVVSTGHSHPRVVEAIQRQAAELIHISGTDFYLPNMVELAERLATVAPGKEPKKVFFGNSGTEAIEAAIKLARYHTRRDKIIAFYGCFHGRTLGSLSLTASRAVQRKGFGALLSGVFHIPYPNSYRCPYGNPSPCDCVESATILEREIFKRIVDPEEVAAVFIEPIQGEGGYVPAPKEFLLELQRICRRHGILLVSDEVQSGMGRTGKWWAGDHAGIEPDILCVAKGIASGMPLSATIARASIMDWKPGAHATTFGGTRDDGSAGNSVHRKRAARRRFSLGPHGELAGQTQDCRRCARQGVDDRRRDRPESKDEGAGARFPRGNREPRI
jgi:4-aminobutyrate aminotransferase